MPQSERRSFTFENVHLAPDEQIGTSAIYLGAFVCDRRFRHEVDRRHDGTFSWRRGSYDTAGNSTLLVF